MRWPDGFRCPRCGHVRHCHLKSRRQIQCNSCRHQTSVTADTVFHSTKLPLTTWFLAIYLLTQTRKGVSAMQLHRQLGISYNAAWRMKHKLMQTMCERNARKRLSGLVQIDDAYLGGERSGGKTPFVAAVQTTGEGQCCTPN